MAHAEIIFFASLRLSGSTLLLFSPRLRVQISSRQAARPPRFFINISASLLFSFFQEKAPKIIH
jgi:hypothetical protein